jgi:hypothetical protein
VAGTATWAQAGAATAIAAKPAIIVVPNRNFFSKPWMAMGLLFLPHANSRPEYDAPARLC